jgi:predicted Zn-dependent protease with MMP-like domain
MAEFVDDLQSMLDTAYEMIAENEIDQAWVLLTRLENEYPESAEVVALMGDAAMKVGDVDYALELYDRAIELDGDWSDGYSARANCLIELNQLDEAWGDIERALKLDDRNPEAHYVRAMLLELDNRQKAADDEYRAAERLDPEGYPMPIRVTRKVFDNAVKKAIALLPPEFKNRMNEVEIFVKDLPDPKETAQTKLSPLILGAFDGFMITERREADPWTQVPPKISLYQKNIERIVRDREELIREIEITILHEVGHYFGLEDEDLERIELG